VVLDRGCLYRIDFAANNQSTACIVSGSSPPNRRSGHNHYAGTTSEQCECLSHLKLERPFTGAAFKRTATIAYTIPVELSSESPPPPSRIRTLPIARMVFDVASTNIIY
jgi:hypothetical protein